MESCSATWRISEITSRMAKEVPVGSRTRTRSSVRGVTGGSRTPSRCNPGITAISGAAIKTPKASSAGDGFFSTIGRQYKEPATTVSRRRAQAVTPITLDRVGNVRWRGRPVRSVAQISRGAAGGSRRRDGDDGGKSAARADPRPVRRPVRSAPWPRLPRVTCARVPISRNGSARKSRRWISTMPCAPTCGSGASECHTAPCALKRMATGAGCGRLATSSWPTRSSSRLILKSRRARSGVASSGLSETPWSSMAASACSSLTLRSVKLAATAASTEPASGTQLTGQNFLVGQFVVENYCIGTIEHGPGLQICKAVAEPLAGFIRAAAGRANQAARTSLSRCQTSSRGARHRAVAARLTFWPA